MKKMISALLLLSVLSACFAFPAFANVLGDVSGDGKVTAEDARLCLRAAVGLEAYAPGSAEFTACDATCDGKVTAEDARLILRAAVGLETLANDDPAPVEPPDYTANNEYDIYRSGTFYMVGTMSDGSGTSPMELGKNASVVYLRSSMDGMEIAMQIIGKDIYMMIPSKQVYYKMDQATAKVLGLEPGDLTKDLDMGSLPPLSAASYVTDGLVDSTACRVYTFDESDGSHTQVYMKGDRFLGLDVFSANWVRTESMRISSITKDLPSKVTTPGSGYRRILLFTTFMGYFA